MASDNVDGYLGVIYLDLFERPGKYPGSSSSPFPLHSSPSPPFLVQFAGAGVFQVRPSSMHHTRGSVVSLVMNISVRNSNPRDIRDVLLSYVTVDTLFHEFGHCLQNFLSRTRYQHTSGARAYLDWVETPSTLMEFFPFDHRVPFSLALSVAYF